MNKLMTALILASVLAGCATAKPQMPDEKYQAFTKGWVSISQCIRNGWIDADTGARGRTYIMGAANTYQYDTDKFKESELQARQSISVNQSDCRELAVAIQARKQQIDNQNATAEIQQRETQNMVNATKPTNTYCNKIGTQVLCSSF